MKIHNKMSLIFHFVRGSEVKKSLEKDPYSSLSCQSEVSQLCEGLTMFMIQFASNILKNKSYKGTTISKIYLFRM